MPTFGSLLCTGLDNSSHGACFSKVTKNLFGPEKQFVKQDLFKQKTCFFAQVFQDQESENNCYVSRLKTF